MNDVTKKIVTLATPYLGPSSERFIMRQITTHLNLTSETLTSEDLDALAKWVEISASLLIDKEKAKELADKIRTFK